jgi:hypothetical protein
MAENPKYTPPSDTPDPERKDKQIDIDELEKDDLDDVSGGNESLAGDKNCGCGPSGL